MNVSSLSMGKSWVPTFVVAFLLSMAGPLGFVLMMLLDNAAARELDIACQINPASAHYSKGYAFSLPAGLLISVVVGIIVMLITMFSRATPMWMKTIGVCTVFVAVVSGLLTWIIVSEYHLYPGTDPTSIMGHPCGFS
jgi:hypothetical protein